MLANIFLCIMRSYLFAMFVCNFTTTILSVAEILLFIKINREDRMLIKVLHQEIDSKKLLAEFSKQRV